MKIFKKVFLITFLSCLASAKSINTTPPIIITNPAIKNNIKNNNTQNITIQRNNNETNNKEGISIKRDYSVLNGKQKSKSDNQEGNLIANLTVKGTSPKKIKQIKKKMTEIQKSLIEESTPIGINKTIKFKKGEEIFVKVKAGFSSLVNFTDDAGNPVQFSYLTVGNNFVKVTQFGNKLEIKPLRRYTTTNIIVGIKGYDYPVTLNIKEVGPEGDSYDNYINVVLIGSFQEKVGSDNIKLKSAILQYVFKYGVLDSLPKIDYEVYSLKTKKPILFSNNVLKIYKVEKFGKTYYLILIDKNFVIYGNKTFGTYNSRYNIYFLNFNQNVFTIRTNPKLGMPDTMTERYRIVIKDF